ncbi:MAG: ATP-binding cassette domain-containing protein, partial [Polaromonas sp.]|nr:ATP-binding cassette domain-containing protein [Polaromonas sp.]
MVSAASPAPGASAPAHAHAHGHAHADAHAHPVGPAAAASPVVTLLNLTVSYRQHPALHHISGSFAPGSLTAIIGPNGSGKSTLLKSIMGLLPIE